MSEAKGRVNVASASGNPRMHLPCRFYWQIVVFVFVLAAGLRVSLAVYNREANDNHYEVVKLILDGRSGLTMADCHECFHPNCFTMFARRWYVRLV